MIETTDEHRWTVCGLWPRSGAENSLMMKQLKGIQASPGIAIGPVYLHDPEDPWIDIQEISEAETETEVQRFLATLEEVAEDVKVIRAQVEEKLGRDYAQIFDAHLLILEDEALKEPTILLIRDERVNAEYAFWRTFQKVRRQFDAIQDDYFRARKADILDIEKRVLAKLCQREDALLGRLTSEAIVVAHDLAPSDTAHMHRDCVLGIVTEVGGTTSHAAIIARGLEIPAVLGVEAAIASAESGDLAIVDGRRGQVYINPDAETLERYRIEAKRFQEAQQDLSSLRDLPAETLDGVGVSLQGNIEIFEEVESALVYGAKGIGLYRTEYLYLASSRLPTEEEQTETYTRIAERMAPHSLVIRTLDLGGDKLSYILHTHPEMNPFLGWRAIRVALANKGLFRSQLRAILRASVKGNIRIMYPMISGVEELIEANEVLEEAREELRAEGVAFDEACPVGAMIEVPAAAVVADQLADEVDFFSIGTNDLIQYTIAVDRANEKVAYLFDPLHPAVLRLIRNVVEVGDRRGIPVTLCGEMAGDPLYSVLLLGLGVDGFSMSPMALPEVKRAIRSVTMAEASALAEAVLSLRTREEIKTYLREALPAEVRQALPEPVFLEVEAEAGGPEARVPGEGRV